MNLTPVPLFLVLLSGACWTLVYLDAIRLGLRQHTYAMPFWALALNIAWELLHTLLGYQEQGLVLQVVINAIWALFDLAIIYTYFRYGKKYLPALVPGAWFIPWSLLVLATAFIVQYYFVVEFGFFGGRAYAAFLQNLLMSVLFIAMLVQRGSSEGQSLTIAVSKWIGTLAPTILFGLLGAEGMNGPRPLLLVLGLLCSVFDLIYIALLVRTKAREGSGRAAVIESPRPGVQGFSLGAARRTQG
jgi:hypothetical protein